MLIQKAYEIFIADRKISGATEHTVAFYKSSAGKLVSYIIEQTGENASVRQVAPYVTSYFATLHSSSLSHTSLHTYYRGIKTFLRFLHTEEYIAKPIRLPSIKAPQTAIKPLSPDQMRKALGAFNTNRFTGIRNQTMLRLFLDTGMRLAELRGVELSTVDLDEGFFLVRGKGGKERWIPFGKETKKALWSYIKQREKVALQGEPALFVTQTGSGMTTRGIQMIFKRLSKKLKLDGIRFSPHTFRHSFALAYIENGGDPFSLQRILGHSSQAMTSKYINMARSNVKAQHSKFSPGDRL